MIVRWWLGLALALVACGAPVERGASVGGVAETAAEVESAGRLSVAGGQPEPGSVPPFVRQWMCWRIDREVEQAIPTIADTWKKVHARFGWDVELREPLPDEAFGGGALPREPGDCDSRLSLGDPRDRNGNEGLGQHNAAARGAAPFEGGASLVTLNRRLVESVRLVDIGTAACVASDPGVYLVAHVLTHELAHALGLEHNTTDPDSVMYDHPDDAGDDFSQLCRDPMPSSEDLAGTVRPAK